MKREWIGNDNQDLDNEKDMYDNQDFIEDDEEGCQEIPDCLPITWVLLLRDLYEQNANTNSEQCFEETSSHLENTESDVEGELAHIGTLPLCYNSFQITQEEWHPDNVEETTHEPCIQIEYHNNHEELSETKEDQEIVEYPQGFPASTSTDSLEEAQEDIQPQIQSSREIKNFCTSAQRKTKMSSPLNE